MRRFIGEFLMYIILICQKVSSISTILGMHAHNPMWGYFFIFT